MGAIVAYGIYSGVEVVLEPLQRVGFPLVHSLHCANL